MLCVKLPDRILGTDDPLYAFLFGFPGICAYTIDLQNRFLSFSQTFIETAKEYWNSEVTVGADMVECLGDSRKRDLYIDRFERARNGSCQFFTSEEKSVIDGCITYAQFINHVLPISDAKGDLSGLIVVTVPEGGDGEFRKTDYNLSLLNTALDQSFDAVYLLDADMRFRYCNETSVRMLGYSREELLSMTLYDIDPDITPEGIRELMHQTEAAGKFPGTVESRHKSKDGAILPVEIGASVFSIHGKTMFLTIVRGISERKQMDAAIKESERKYRSLAESSPDDIARFDGEGRCLYANNMLMEKINLNYAGMVLGKRPSEIWKDNSFGELEEMIRRVFRTGKHEVMMHSLISRDGNIRYSHVYVAPEQDSRGKTSGTIAFGREITDALETERRLRVIMDTVPAALACIRRFDDGGYKVLHTSKGVYNVFGFPDSHDGDIFALIKARMHPDDLLNSNLKGQEAAQAGSKYTHCFRYIHPERGELWVSQISTPVRDSGPGTLWYGLFFDITEQKRMEETLASREREARTLLENTPDTIARYDHCCRRIYANRAFATAFSGNSASLLGKRPTECPGGPSSEAYERKIKSVLETGIPAQYEMKWTDVSGRQVCSLINLTPEPDSNGRVSSVLSVGRDITELFLYREQIHNLAFYDPLTSLPNRTLFHDRLVRMLTESERHRYQSGVMLIDLDRFKTVNDTLGHHAGDLLLSQTAKRFTECIRSNDTVARLGGDEFAVLLPEIRRSEDLGLVAEKLLKSFQTPFYLNDKEIFLSCSIGIALFPDDSKAPGDLLKYADSAMYHAKNTGRNGFRFYSHGMTESAQERLRLEGDLRKAIVCGEMALHYQPKIDLESGRIIGSEALVRWNHPDLGLLTPDSFIGIAEDSGLIVEIGEWVLRTACRTAKIWNETGLGPHKVAINLSPRQFQSGDIVKTIRSALEETGCRPRWIELEITESLLLGDDEKIIGILQAFHQEGMTLAIDDFGTGYSSLSYLMRLPVDTLKIDRSFVFGIGDDSNQPELVSAIISIARSLNKIVVAEGVETESQKAFLRKTGCELAQGYLFGKPVPREAFEMLPGLPRYPEMD